MQRQWGICKDRYEHIPATYEIDCLPDDEIDLPELFATLWRGKWFITATTILFAVAGVFYALSKPNIYQASVLLAPAQSEGNSDGISGQLGGLAGINLGGGSSIKTVMSKQVMQSRAFLTDFIHRHDLSVPLMVTEGWSMEKQDWVINSDVYNQQTGEWLKNEDGKSQKLTNWDLVKRFKAGHLSTSDNQETGVVIVNIKSQSPSVAKQWAE